jgi:hypothetical protein
MKNEKAEHSLARKNSLWEFSQFVELSSLLNFYSNSEFSKFAELNKF